MSMRRWVKELLHGPRRTMANLSVDLRFTEVLMLLVLLLTAATGVVSYVQQRQARQHVEVQDHAIIQLNRNFAGMATMLGCTCDDKTCDCTRMRECVPGTDL